MFLGFMILLGLFLGIGWILFSNKEHTYTSDVLRNSLYDTSYLKEISHAFNGSKKRFLKNRLRFFTIDKYFFEDEDLEYRADMLLEEYLGHKDLQLLLKDSIQLLEKEREVLFDSVHISEWEDHVTSTLALTMNVSNDLFEHWWYAIEMSDNLEELALRYPNFQHSIWDIYINRNDIRLIYASAV